MVQVTRELLTPFVLRCVGRWNDYALQQADGRYKRAGHALSEQSIFLHLQGIHTLGTYVINEEGLCRFVVYDSDVSTGLSDLLQVQLTLAGAGVRSYPEMTRRGAHLWVFFSEPLPPALVRAYLLPFCPVGVEFYPKQDSLTPESPYGSLIRLPLGIHRLTGERYPFVEVVNGQVYPLASSVVDMLSVFSELEHMNLPLVLPQPSAPTLIHTAPTHTIPFNPSLGSGAAGAQMSIRDWCIQQDPLEVIGRYVDLNASGVGSCPFGFHHDDGVDTHPSLYVYRPTAPDLRCWYCHTWGQGGSLFDFFRLYYGLEARDLWHRILSGAQF
jgi:hypothetical protein